MSIAEAYIPRRRRPSWRQSHAASTRLCTRNVLASHSRFLFLSSSLSPRLATRFALLFVFSRRSLRVHRRSRRQSVPAAATPPKGAAATASLGVEQQPPDESSESKPRVSSPSQEKGTPVPGSASRTCPAAEKEVEAADSMGKPSTGCDFAAFSTNAADIAAGGTDTKQELGRAKTPGKPIEAHGFVCLQFDLHGKFLRVTLVGGVPLSISVPLNCAKKEVCLFFVRTNGSLIPGVHSSSSRFENDFFFLRFHNATPHLTERAPDATVSPNFENIL